MTDKAANLESLSNQQNKEAQNEPDDISLSVDKVLEELEDKSDLSNLEKESQIHDKRNFEERRSEVLKKSTEFGEEKNLSEEEKRKEFKNNFRKHAEVAKNERRNGLIWGYIYPDGEKENGNESDKKVVVEKLKEIRALLNQYEINNPEEILDKEPETIKLFADALSKIVNISQDELIRGWIELRKEEIEWGKLKKLMEDNEASEEIYTKTVEAGDREVDLNSVFEENKNLVEEENKKAEELEARFNENKEPITDESKPKDTYMDNLNVEQKEKVQHILESSNTTTEKFEEVIDFVDAIPDPSELDIENGNISFNVLSPRGLSIPISVLRDEIVLNDPSGEVKIKLGDKDAYKLESEIFDVKNVLKHMELEDGVYIPREIKTFMYSRDLAKFVNYISEYKAQIAGKFNDKLFEIRRIYEHILKKSPEQSLRLRKNIEKCKDENEIRELAIKEQGKIY